MSNSISPRRRRCAFAIGMVLVAGCRAPWRARDPEYQAVVCTARANCDVPAEILAATAVLPVAEGLAEPQPVEHFVDIALAQNPRIQAKRKLVEAAVYRIPQARSLEDPMLGTTSWPSPRYSLQTSGGRMTVDAMVSQKVPWVGKLHAQACVASAEAEMARAELAAAEQDVIEQVRKAYYELYYAQRAMVITEESRRLAVDFSKVAESRYRAAAVTEQDLLRAQLEVANVDAELVKARQQRASAQARLARLIHTSPDTPLAAVDKLPSESLSVDLESLYQQAIAARPELHAQLAAINRDRQSTALARLRYYPDVTVGVGWGEMTTNQALAPTADGLDMYSLSLGANIPLYRKRLDAGVREAEARVVASARELDALRDQTQEEIKDLFTRAVSQQALLELFSQQIIPKAEQTLRASQAAYESGKVDFLQLIDNWREVLRYRLAYHELEGQLRQTLAGLARLVGPAATIVSPGEDLPPAAPANQPE